MCEIRKGRRQKIRKGPHNREKLVLLKKKKNRNKKAKHPNSRITVGMVPCQNR